MNGRPCSGSGWGVESGRRLVLWPELPSAHTPPVSAWSNRRGLTGSTAAITADRRATRPSYAAIASTPLADRSRWLLNSCKEPRPDRGSPSIGRVPGPVDVAPASPPKHLCGFHAYSDHVRQQGSLTVSVSAKPSTCACYTRASVRPSAYTPEGQVAQLVEHRTENAGVAGSIPALATNLRSPGQSPMSYGWQAMRFVVHLQDPLAR
jgi:hypothetical protein